MKELLFSNNYTTQTSKPVPVERNGFTYYKLNHVLLFTSGVHGRIKQMRFDPDVIIDGFNNTDWEDKKNLEVYIEHNDTKDGVRNWAGYIENPIQEGDKLYGDVILEDVSVARKLALGAKFGISPKIEAVARNRDVSKFAYKNFSIVLDPACVQTYLNSNETELDNEDIKIVKELNFANVTAMENKRKSLGLSVAQFYAVPRDPPSESKLPIYDAIHTRNALARFNQTQFANNKEKATALRKIHAAAKKFGIKVGDKSEKKFKNEQEEDKMPIKRDEIFTDTQSAQQPTKPAQTVQTTPLDQPPIVNKQSITDNTKQATEQKTPQLNEVTQPKIDDKTIEAIAAIIMDKQKESQEAKKPKENTVSDTSQSQDDLKKQLAERDAKISELTEKMSKLEKEFNKPRIKSKPTQINDKLKDMDSMDLSKAILEFLKKKQQGVGI